MWARPCTVSIHSPWRHFFQWAGALHWQSRSTCSISRNAFLCFPDLLFLMKEVTYSFYFSPYWFLIPWTILRFLKCTFPMKASLRTLVPSVKKLKSKNNKVCSRVSGSFVVKPLPPGCTEWGAHQRKKVFVSAGQVE